MLIESLVFWNLVLLSNEAFALLEQGRPGPGIKPSIDIHGSLHHPIKFRIISQSVCYVFSFVKGKTWQYCRFVCSFFKEDFKLGLLTDDTRMFFVPKCDLRGMMAKPKGLLNFFFRGGGLLKQIQEKGLAKSEGHVPCSGVSLWD